MRLLRFGIVVLFFAAGLSGCTILREQGLISGSVLFEESFSAGQTGMWFLEGDDIAQSSLVDDSLVISVDMPQTVQYAALQEPLFEDFVLEVDVTQLEGNASNSFGVLFRLQNPNQFYRFEITGDGLYVVEKSIEEGQWQRLSDGWVESPFIIQGLNRTNRLKIEVVGTQMKFFINERQVDVLADASYSRGQIALDAGTFGEGGLRVRFDNLVVKEP